MSRINKKNTVSGIYQVVDTNRVGVYFGKILLFLIWLGLCLFLIKYYPKNELLWLIILIAIIMFPKFIINIFLFQVHRKGYIVSVEDDVFIFPGGKIAAKTFLETFSPSYLLQSFKQHSIFISDIRQIDKIKSNGLHIDGEFGSIDFSLDTAKRDELYSLLIRTLQQSSGTLETDFE